MLVLEIRSYHVEGAGAIGGVQVQSHDGSRRNSCPRAHRLEHRHLMAAVALLILENRAKIAIGRRDRVHRVDARRRDRDRSAARSDNLQLVYGIFGLCQVTAKRCCCSPAATAFLTFLTAVTERAHARLMIFLFDIAVSAPKSPIKKVFCCGASQHQL